METPKLEPSLLPPQFCIVRKLESGTRAKNQTQVLDTECKHLTIIFTTRPNAHTNAYILTDNIIEGCESSLLLQNKPSQNVVT